MKRILATTIALLLMTSAAYAAPGRGAPAKPPKGQGHQAVGIGSQSVESSPTTRGKAKGKSKFELDGNVSATGADSLSVLVKGGTNTVRRFRRTTVSIGVTGSTKITRKGRPITLSGIVTGDRVHVRGTVATDSGSPVLTAKVVTARPAKQ